MSPAPLLVGAVAYTANVVPIWEGIREYFAGTEAEMDFVLYSNYGRQVDALVAGQIDVAWNTNLAWARTVLQTGGACRAVASRDIDLTFHSVLVSQAGAGFEGPASLKGRRIALGSADSAQAAILPLHYLAEAGVAESDLKVIRINSDLGKHGDTGRSELDAIRMVLDGDADAAAIGNTTWQSIGRDELMPGALEAFWTTPRYSHCTFTVMDSTAAERTDPWVERLLAMDWNVPEQRRIMELEGCERSWVPPNLAGYESLFAAVELQGVSARW